jgi:hypothetical protein
VRAPTNSTVASTNGHISVESAASGGGGSYSAPQGAVPSAAHESQVRLYSLDSLYALYALYSLYTTPDIHRTNHRW